MSVSWSEIDHFIQQADQILIVSHRHPDGDAIGSTLAVHHACQQLGIPSVCVNDSPTPQRFSFLPDVERIRFPDQIDRQFQHVIAVDSADQGRLGESVRSLIAPNANCCNLDHHPTNDHFGTLNIVDANASSTAEVLYRWIDHSSNISWNQAIATYIYTGMLDDTGGFRYANTSSDLLRHAASLIDMGAPAARIAEHVLETMTLARFQLLQKALSTLRQSSDGRVAWMTLHDQDVAGAQSANEDFDGIVNWARNLEGVEVGIFFREHGDEVKVSFRSSQLINVAIIAQDFGGGGHRMASGCSIPGELSEIKHQVLKRVAEELEREG